MILLDVVKLIPSFDEFVLQICILGLLARLAIPTTLNGFRPRNGIIEMRLNNHK